MKNIKTAEFVDLQPIKDKVSVTVNPRPRPEKVIDQDMHLLASAIEETRIKTYYEGVEEIALGEEFYIPIESGFDRDNVVIMHIWNIPDRDVKTIPTGNGMGLIDFTSDNQIELEITADEIIVRNVQGSRPYKRIELKTQGKYPTGAWAKRTTPSGSRIPQEKW